MSEKMALVIAQPTRAKQQGPAPAWQLYRGSQQRLVQDGLRTVWDRFGFRALMDEVVLSPLHGPVWAGQVLEPYDFGWKGRPRAEVAEHVRRTAVIERLEAMVAGYDLVLVLLSRVYLAPLQLPRWVPGRAPQRWLFFASGEGLPFLPLGSNARLVPAGMAEARRERVKALDLKAHLFRRLCLDVAGRGEQALADAWADSLPVGRDMVMPSRINHNDQCGGSE
ncbi:MAG TPA: hypothetical protein VNT75_17480 [Symbiobacteriaceae bacterium]|nr:hypothetical protein [Symbiobacteriaceae bacterium]